MQPSRFLSTLALLGALLIAGVYDADAFSRKPPKNSIVIEPQQPPTVLPPVVVKPEEPVNVGDAEKAKALIVQVASQSPCGTYRFKDRGLAPKSYLEGVSLVYARSVCRPDPVVSSTANGPASKDALTHYGLLGSNRNAYALLIGLGMRESSGGVDCGRDAAASNTASETAEAGIFQTSWNITYCSTCPNKKKPELMAIWNAYQKDERKCFAQEFSRTVTCKKSQFEKNYGDKNSAGYAYQVKAKACPAFATEFAVNSIRTTRSHYGPLKTKAAEYKSQCVDMLKKVEEIVQSNPSVCDIL